MSDTSVHSKPAKVTPLTPAKPAALKGEDLALVAERLSLIQGHLSQMPKGVISGAKMHGEWLLVAVSVPGYTLNIVSGAWLLDGKDVTQLNGKQE